MGDGFCTAGVWGFGFACAWKTLIDIAASASALLYYNLSDLNVTEETDIVFKMKVPMSC